MIDQPDIKQLSIQQIIERRNHIARLLREANLLSDQSHCTMSALGLLFVEATGGNLAIISLNIQQLLSMSEHMEVVNQQFEMDGTAESDPKKIN